MKKIIILLFVVPMLLGISDYINMYTFNRVADKILMIVGFMIIFVAFLSSLVLTMTDIKKYKKNRILIDLLITVYSLTYLIIILFTYVIPYLEFEY